MDASNEAKFDRLLKEDKLKSPFRRHPSNEVFDEAAKAELMRHDPSILDFKVGMSTSGYPSTVVRTVSGELIFVRNSINKSQIENLNHSS